MPFARLLLLLRLFLILALVMLVLGFALMIAPLAYSALAKACLMVGFGGSLITSIWLAKLTCPACHEPFLGLMGPEDTPPTPHLFSNQCRYCGHRPS